jgi:signal transduction histidine kinase
MDLFKNISLNARLRIIGLFILGLMMILGWQGIVGMRDINKKLHSIYTNQYSHTKIVANTNIALTSWNRAVLNHILAEKRTKEEGYEQVILKEKNIIIKHIEVLSNMKNLSEREMAMVNKLQDRFEHADLLQERVVALSEEGKDREARALIRAELRPIIDEQDKNMTEFVLLQEKQFDEVIKIAGDQYNLNRRNILLIFGCSLGLTFFFIFNLTNYITKNISKLVRGLELMSEGKYKLAKVSIPTTDKFGYLALGFNQMIDKIEQNISRVQRIQEDLLRQEKFALLGKLSGSIAHEIKNPLAVIDSSVYILKMKLGNTDDKIATHLDKIKNQVDMANHIIISLQDMVNMKKMAKTTSDIVDLIEKGISFSGISGNGVKITKEVEKGKYFINADINQLAIVFKNIISNAIQAMDKKGDLLITATGIDNKECEISFKDSGPGIVEDKLKKIFEPFYSTKAKNIGLGLALTKNIIEENNGTIEASSEIGKGSVFIVRLPISKT